MNELLRAALGYTARGWRVFPLHGVVNGRCTCGSCDCSSPGKHPIVRRGLHEATTDLEVIERWWCQWPRANIGIVTGSESGIVVIDIDLPRALESLDGWIHKLPRTLMGLTGGGGVHLIYRGGGVHLIYRGERPLRCTCSRMEADLGRSSSPSTPRSVPSGHAISAQGAAHRCSELGCDLGRSKGENQCQARVLRNTTGRLPGIPHPLPGVDLRGEGGYIVAPPSLHVSGNRYSWLDDTVEIACAPAWLREPPPRRIVLREVRPRFEGDGTRVGLKVLRNQLAILAGAREGERNHTLNRCAFVLAHYVAAGHLRESSARAELMRVGLSIGLTHWETDRTIDSAFSAAGRIR